MRISDWSSDVCSSDLGECLHSPRGGKTGRRLAQDLVRLPELAVLPLQLLDPRPIRARRPRPRPLIALGLPHPPAQRLRRAADLAGNRADRSPLRAVLARMLQRSEEHTSELQSLMRISYAVFRLKKNNTTKH